MVTLIYSLSFSNYLREGIDEVFDLLSLNRFGGLPGGGPGTPFETRGRFFDDFFAGIARGGCFFGICGLGLSFVRLAFDFSSSVSRFRFFTFRMTTSPYEDECDGMHFNCSFNDDGYSCQNKNILPLLLHREFFNWGL